MRDLRNSTALRQLADLGPDPGPSPWVWAIVRLDPKGRVALPAEARRAFGARPGERISVRGRCHRVALVVAPDGAGAAMTVDSRGRLVVPAWLRRGPDAGMVVAIRRDTPVIVVAPTTVLDGLGDILVGPST